MPADRSGDVTQVLAVGAQGYLGGIMLNWPTIPMLTDLLDLEHLLPGAISLGVGGLVGWVAARIIKRTAKVLGCLVAIAFVLLQVLAYFGVVHWTWPALAEYTGGLEHAAIAALARLRVLTYNVPFTAGGLLGFLCGLRRR